MFGRRREKKEMEGNATTSEIESAAREGRGRRSGIRAREKNESLG